MLGAPVILEVYDSLLRFYDHNMLKLNSNIFSLKEYFKIIDDCK